MSVWWPLIVFVVVWGAVMVGTARSIRENNRRIDEADETRGRYQRATDRLRDGGDAS